MTKLGDRLADQVKKFEHEVKRFYIPFGLTVVLFLVVSTMTIVEPKHETAEIFMRIVQTLVFSIFTCTLIKMLYEKYNLKKWNNIMFDLPLMLLSFTPYILLHCFQETAFVSLALGGIILSEIIFIFYLSMPQSKASEIFSYFFKNILFGFFVCGVTYAGVSICITAFTALIYDPDSSYKAYEISGYFCYIVLFLIMCLSSIPRLDEAEQKLTIPKVFRIIISKFMLPIYLLLLTILYIYLGKILIIQSFPSGQVNWFVSFSSLLFIFFVFSLSQYKHESKLIGLFLKYSGFLIIPTIIMQFVSIYIRVSNYGLTTFRYASISLNIFALIFVILFLFKREKGLKASLVILVVFVLLATVTPINMIDMPMKEQSARLSSLLTENKMLTNSKIVPNSDIDPAEKSKILAAYSYIKDNESQSSYRPDFIDDKIMEKPKEEIFGFGSETESASDEGRVRFYYDYTYIDTKNYSKVYILTTDREEINTKNNQVVVQKNKESHIIDGLYDYLKEVYTKHRASSDEMAVNKKVEYKFGENKLILSDFTMLEDTNGEVIIVFSRGSYLLEK